MKGGLYLLGLATAAAGILDLVWGEFEAPINRFKPGQTTFQGSGGTYACADAIDFQRAGVGASHLCFSARPHCLGRQRIQSSRSRVRVDLRERDRRP